jgi:hypothetical protein
MILFAILLVVPLGLYFLNGGGRGPAWGLLPAGEAPRGGGAYRQTHVRAWKAGQAPLAVRLAALSSFFLGQMIVPGMLAAFGGMVALANTFSSTRSSPLLAVLLLSTPTGILVAASLLSSGSAMLNRAYDAAPRARSTARWALGHNLALLAALGLVAALRPDEADSAFLPAVYACVSLAQAFLMRRAARALDVYAARQDADDAPPEAELHVLGTVR